MLAGAKHGLLRRPGLRKKGEASGFFDASRVQLLKQPHGQSRAVVPHQTTVSISRLRAHLQALTCPRVCHIKVLTARMYAQAHVHARMQPHGRKRTHTETRAHKHGKERGEGGERETSEDAGALESGGRQPGVRGVLLDPGGASQAAVPALVPPRTVLCRRTITRVMTVGFTLSKYSRDDARRRHKATKSGWSSQQGSRGGTTRDCVREQNSNSTPYVFVRHARPEHQKGGRHKQHTLPLCASVNTGPK